MSDRMEVEMPDGTVIDAPAGTTRAQIEAKWKGAKGPTLPGETMAVADKIIRGGLLGAPKAIAELFRGQQERQANDPSNLMNYTPAGMLLNARGAVVPKEADAALISAMTPQTPKTQVGKYIGSLGEGAVSAAATGPLRQAGQLAQVGAGAGLGSEAAAHVGGDNMLSRLLGGLAGGGIVAGVKALKPNAESLVRTATKGVTAPDWANARALETDLTAMGLPHLKSQLLGPNSSLDDVVKEASANPGVRPTILKATRDVTPQAGQAYEVWANRNLPVQADERRDFLAGLQRTAAEREAELKKAANAEYRGALPSGVASEVYPEQFMQNLRQELTALAKDPAQLKGSAAGESILSDLLPRLATKGNGMAKGELNNIIKDLNTLTQKEGWSGLGGTRVGQLLKDYTANDFGAARNAKAKFTADQVEPMQQGLAGDIAHARGGPQNNRYTAAESTLTNVFPLDKAQPLAIKKLAEDVGGEQVGLLLREHLTRNFERAAKGAEENVTSPAKFVEAVVGTPAQRKNVEAALMESATAQGQNPQAVKAGFQQLINAFATYKDLKVASGVSGANLQFSAGTSAAGSAIAPQSRLARYVWEKTSEKAFQKIADMVASKDGLAQLEAIARRRDPSYTTALVAGMLATKDGEAPVSNSPALQSRNPNE